MEESGGASNRDLKAPIPATTLAHIAPGLSGRLLSGPVPGHQQGRALQASTPGHQQGRVLQASTEASSRAEATHTLSRNARIERHGAMRLRRGIQELGGREHQPPMVTNNATRPFEATCRSKVLTRRVVLHWAPPVVTPGERRTIQLKIAGSRLERQGEGHAKTEETKP